MTTSSMRWPSPLLLAPRRQTQPMARWHLPVLVLSAAAAADVSGSTVTEDRNPYCGDWAAQGECGRNSAFMFRHCGRSCWALAEAAVRQADGPAEQAGTESVDAKTGGAAVAEQVAAAPPVRERSDRATADGALQPARQEEQAKPAAPPGSAVSAATASSAAAAPLKTSQGASNSLGPDAPLAPDPPLASQGQDLVRVNAQLQICMEEVIDMEHRITQARMGGFDELRKAHEEELREELLLAEKKHRREMEGLRFEVSELKKELFQKQEFVHALESRLRKAEEQLQRRAASEHCHLANSRAHGLEEQLRAAEAELFRKKTAFIESSSLAARNVEQLERRTQEAEARSESASARAVAAEAAARNARRRELRALRFARAKPRAAAAANVAGVDSSWQTCGANSTPEVRASAVEPMSIELDEWLLALLPSHDASISMLFVDLCGRVADASIGDQAGGGQSMLTCGALPALRVSMWVASFAFVAAWRCVWVFVFQRIVAGTCVRLARALFGVHGGARCEAS